MAIENTYLLGKNITLGCGFDLQAKAPLDSRQTVPSTAGLQALIDGNAAYEGMIVYDEESKKTYQAQIVDDVLTFREFGINEAELKDLIASETTAAMEFKGATTALPENPAKGDMYKVTASFKIGEEDVKVGDSIVYNGEQWFIIPSGDDIEDTWRPVTDVDNDSTLTFAAGDKLEKTVAADGTITYKHIAIDAPEDMTAVDDEKTRTYITKLITDNHGHIVGFKTATENVEDTNTTYEFEGQSDEATSVYFQVKSSDADAAEVIYLDTYSKNETDAKFVAKETGKSLIDDSEIERLTTLKNYDDTALAGRVTNAENKITNLEEESAKHALKADIESEFAKYTKTEDLPTDLGDFTNEAGYAKTADVNAELGKKADKTQVAADIGEAIAPLATTKDLNDVKVIAETARTESEVDAQIDAKITALKLGETYEPIGAEQRAIDAAKNETESQITEFAKTVYTKTEVEALLTWGSF